jgi:hypothetical protein
MAFTFVNADLARCMVSHMTSRSSLAVPFAIFLGACSSSSSASGGAATSAASDANTPGASSGPSDAAGSREPTDAGSGTDVGLGIGGGSCPARGNAAACPAPPPSVPNLGYWVGCEATGCPSETSCTTCSCVEGDGGPSWQCTTTDGFQPETDAQPTPYCALYSGPIDAGDLDDAGPFEQCTPQYPSCAPPYPESPGWQCCLISSAGSISEISCMPNDAGEYRGNFPHP